MILDFLDNPQKSADHLVLGMTREQIQTSKTTRKNRQQKPSPHLGLDRHAPYTGEGRVDPSL